MPKQATVILKWVAASAIVIAIIWGIYYVATNQTRVGQELGMATSRQPEPLTELYFANPESLPASISPATRELAVSFTVHNLEAKPMDYTYRVVFADSQHTVAAPDGLVSLPDGQSTTISQIIQVPAGQTRGEISVQLIGKSQKIHYWLERL